VQGYTDAYTISNEALDCGATKCRPSQVMLFLIGIAIKYPLIGIVCILGELAILLEVISNKCISGCEQLFNWLSKM
jgi:hypothetical protein